MPSKRPIPPPSPPPEPITIAPTQSPPPDPKPIGCPLTDPPPSLASTEAHTLFKGLLVHSALSDAFGAELLSAPIPGTVPAAPSEPEPPDPAIAAADTPSIETPIEPEALETPKDRKARKGKPQKSPRPEPTAPSPEIAPPPAQPPDDVLPPSLSTLKPEEVAGYMDQLAALADACTTEIQEATSLRAYLEERKKQGDDEDQQVAEAMDQTFTAAHRSITLPPAPSRTTLDPSVAKSMIHVRQLLDEKEAKKSLKESRRMLVGQKTYMQSTHHTLPPSSYQKPPAQRKAHRTSEAVKQLWAGSMHPKERREVQDHMRRLVEKQRFLKNPRFKGSETFCFEAKPAELTFADYEPNQVYELQLVLRNITPVSHRIRVLPLRDKHFGVLLPKFSGMDGLVAPGMACRVAVRFQPNSLADFDDVLSVVPDSGPSLDVPLRARRDSPVLTIGSELDCGFTLVNDSAWCEYECRNTGGPGRFIIVPEENWPTAKYKATDGPVQIEPFSVQPAMFSLARGESTTIGISFNPRAATPVTRRIVLVCDNCQTRTLTVKGAGCMPSLHLSHFEGVQVDQSSVPAFPKEVLFGDTAVGADSKRRLTIANDTPHAIPYHWSILQDTPHEVPAAATTGVTPSPDVAESEADTEKLMTFTMEPAVGVFPANGEVEFLATFYPVDIAPHLATAQLIAESVPSSASDDGCLRDETMLELDLSGRGAESRLTLVPPLIDFASKLTLGEMHRRAFYVTNSSKAQVSFHWGMAEGGGGLVTVEPRVGTLPSESTSEFEVIVMAQESGSLAADIVCAVANGPPSILRVQAEMSGPVVRFEEPAIVFGLVRSGVCSHERLTLVNDSGVEADFALAVENLGGVFNDVLDIVPLNGIIAPHERVVVDVALTAVERGSRSFLLNCVVAHSTPSFIQVAADVQVPELYLEETHFDFGCQYVGVPVTRSLVLHNATLLDASFTWSSDPSIHVNPVSGTVPGRGTMTVELTLVPSEPGPLDAVLGCTVDGMAAPIGVLLKAAVEGLLVALSVVDGEGQDCLNTAVEEARAIPFGTPHAGASAQLRMHFGDNISVHQISCRHLLLRNLSTIPTSFSCKVETFPADQPPPPEPSQRILPKKRQVPRPASRSGQASFRSHDGQAHVAKRMEEESRRLVAARGGALASGRGAAFQLSPSDGELSSEGMAVVEVTLYCNAPGLYEDVLVFEIPGLPVWRVPLRAGVCGPALTFVPCTMGLALPVATKDPRVTTTNRLSTAAATPAARARAHGWPVLQFGSATCNGNPISKTVKMYNSTPFAQRVAWHVKIPPNRRDETEMPLSLHLCNDDSDTLHLVVKERMRDQGEGDGFTVEPPSLIVPPFGNGQMIVSFSAIHSGSFHHVLLSHPHVEGGDARRQDALERLALGAIMSKETEAELYGWHPHAQPPPQPTPSFRLDVFATAIGPQLDPDRSGPVVFRCSTGFPPTHPSFHRMLPLTNRTPTQLTFSIGISNDANVSVLDGDAHDCVSPFSIVAMRVPGVPQPSKSLERTSGLVRPTTATITAETPPPGMQRSTTKIKSGLGLPPHTHSLSLAPGASVEVDLRISPPFGNDLVSSPFKGEHAGTLLAVLKGALEVRFSTGAEQLVPLEGRLTRAIVGALPTSIDFGLVHVTAAASRRFVLSNASPAPALWKIQCEDECWEFDPASGELGECDGRTATEVEVSVRFMPRRGACVYVSEFKVAVGRGGVGAVLSCRGEGSTEEKFLRPLAGVV